MAKRKNRKLKEEAVAIDMSRYVESEKIHDRCVGCNKVFGFVGPEGGYATQKCLTYSNPASKWPKEGEKVAMMMATVRDIDDRGKSALIEREIPVIEKVCPVASHVKQREIVNVVLKTRAGQQKHRR